MVFKPEAYTCFADSIPNTLWESFTLERIHVGASGRGPVREEYTPRPIHVAQCCSPSARVLASLAASGRFAAFGFKNAKGIYNICRWASIFHFENCIIVLRENIHPEKHNIYLMNNAQSSWNLLYRNDRIIL